MSAKNNLQNALKNAFNNHEEPLKEAQWERLEGVIQSNKPKRRIIPFFFSLLLVCLTAGVTYILTLNYGIDSKPEPMKSSTKSFRETTAIAKNENQKRTDAYINKSHPKVTFSPKNDFFKSNNNNSNKTLVVVTDNYGQKHTDTEGETIEEHSKDYSTEEIEPSQNKDLDLTSKDNIFEEGEENIAMSDIVLKDNDTLVKKTDKIKRENTNKSSSKVVISFAAGYSRLGVKIKDIENEDRMHKDTRALFQQSNKNSNAVFFNLGFDFRLFPGFNIGLNSGVQYLKISTPVNISYKLAEIPFYDSDHRVIGYYNLPDKNIIDLNTKTKNVTTYINVPLRFNYTIPIDHKNELLLTGGANFCAIVSARGNTIALDERAVNSLDKNHYSKLSTGFLGGLQYSHRLKDPWWLGVETQYLSNKLKFDAGFGNINAKLNGYRVNLILKYKFR